MGGNPGIMALGGLAGITGTETLSFGGPEGLDRIGGRTGVLVVTLDEMGSGTTEGAAFLGGGPAVESSFLFLFLWSS